MEKDAAAGAAPTYSLLVVLTVGALPLAVGAVLGYLAMQVTHACRPIGEPADRVAVGLGTNGPTGAAAAGAPATKRRAPVEAERAEELQWETPPRADGYDVVRSSAKAECGPAVITIVASWCRACHAVRGRLTRMAGVAAARGGACRSGGL